MILNRSKQFAGPALIVLAAFAATLPQLFRGNSCGHDFSFHLISWLDCLNAWRHGIFYPHWAPSANFGAGEPRFVFYPPITWLLGAALGILLPWQFVPMVLTLLLLAAAGLATRTLARQALPEGPATLAGCAAIFCGYTLFCAYERSAFAEMTGGFWLPLLLLLILRDRKPSAFAFKRAFDGSATPLALVIAGAWLSNAPVGVMACYLLAALALAAALIARSYAPIVRAAIATLIGLGLAAFYLIPAAWEQRWVDISQATTDSGEMIEANWLFARHADPSLAYHDDVLHSASVIAVSMLAVAFAGIFIAWRRGTFPRRWLPVALIPPAILFLLLPISLPLWNLLPKLSFLQFPWRWLVALEAPMAIFFAAAVWPAAPARRWLRSAVIAACVLLFVCISLYAINLFFQVCDDDETVAATMGVYRTGQGFEGAGEYGPPGFDHDLVPPPGFPGSCLAANLQSASPASDAQAPHCEVPIQSTAIDPEHLAQAANLTRPGYLVLRLNVYPAWHVRVNGNSVTPRTRSASPLMVVPVPQGPVVLTVDWTTTPDVLIGRWLSLLALILVTGLCLLERRLNPTGLS